MPTDVGILESVAVHGRGAAGVGSSVPSALQIEDAARAHRATSDGGLGPDLGSMLDRLEQSFRSFGETASRMVRLTLAEEHVCAPPANAQEWALLGNRNGGELHYHCPECPRSYRRTVSTTAG